MNASVGSFREERQRVKKLENFIAIMRRKHPILQVRSDSEETLKHVLKEACEQLHLEYSNTRLGAPACSGRSENNVRLMKERAKRRIDSNHTLGIVFLSHILSSLWYKLDLPKPRLAWDKQKKLRRHQDTVYWVDKQLAQRVTLFMKHSQLIVSPKLLRWNPENSYARKCLRHLGLHHRSL